MDILGLALNVGVEGDLPLNHGKAAQGVEIDLEILTLGQQVLDLSEDV